MVYRQKTAYSFFNVLASKTGAFISKFIGSKKLKKYSAIVESAYPQSPSALHAETLLGYKFLSACAAGFIIILFIHNLYLVFPVALTAGIAGYFFPDLILKKIINDREKEIARDLPYIIDLLYITALSGQNIYNSIRILAQACRGKFAIELAIFIKMLDFGLTRQDAYKNFARRNGAEDLSNLLFLLIQAEQYGSSISEILKQKSKYLRFEILQRFETRARRSSIAILFPLVFLILPAFILLVGGPLIFSIAGSFITV